MGAGPASWGGPSHVIRARARAGARARARAEARYGRTAREPSRPRAADADDAAQLPDGADDLVELVGGADHDLEAVQRLLVGRALHLGAADVDADGADRLGDGGEHPRLIDAHDLEVHQPRAVGAAFPDHLDAP